MIKNDNFFENAEPPKKDRKGLLVVYTGEGKGKTTASLGTAFRALGWGWKVSVVQFIKGRWITGEKRLADNFSLPIDIHPMGDGFTWNVNDRGKDIETCNKVWSFVEKIIEKQEHDLVILDEINIALQHNYIDVERIIKTLENRPPWMTVILTGRGAPERLFEVADLVSNVQEVKHPFKSGIVAQKGIDF